MGFPPKKTRPPRQKAVAIQHTPASQDTAPSVPKIIASGHGHVAEQILQVAFAQGIRVREDADLTEILSKIEVDTEIPLEAFAAVAEILARVYQANGEAAHMAAHISQKKSEDETPHT
jgi:flagellar biosynthesis protein